MANESKEEYWAPKTRKVSFLSVCDSPALLLSVNGGAPSMDTLRFSYSCARTALDMLNELPTAKDELYEHRYWAIGCLLELTTACLAAMVPPELNPD